MANCILVGKPNVGKTSFFLSFAEYLGMTSCTLETTDIHGEKQTKTYSIDIAKKYLISSEPFKTKDIYRIQLSIPLYKGRKEFSLLDTGGIVDGINKDEHIRRSMSCTLMEFSTSDVIVHMMDASNVYSKTVSCLTEIDYQINEYGRLKGGYCILANKMDLEPSKRGFEFIKREFQNTYVIPVSSVKKTGFKEVKMFVGRNI